MTLQPIRDAEDAGDVVQTHVQGLWQDQLTTGDGACAIHAALGTPLPSGFYHCRAARLRFCQALGTTYDQFRDKILGPRPHEANAADKELFSRWERNIWLDVISPCISANFQPDLIEGDREAQLMCEELQNRPQVQGQLLARHSEGLRKRAVLDDHIERVAVNFRYCCTRGNEIGFVIPFLTSLDLLNELKNEPLMSGNNVVKVAGNVVTKYDALF